MRYQRYRPTTTGPPIIHCDDLLGDILAKKITLTKKPMCLAVGLTADLTANRPARIPGCLGVRVHVCGAYISVRVRTFVGACVCVCTRAGLNGCIGACMWVCVRACICLCVCVRDYTKFA